MNTTAVDNRKLMPWYYAVNWGAMLLEQHIIRMEAIGLDVELHKERLAELEDLKQFLSMSWDMWVYQAMPTMEAGK